MSDDKRRTMFPPSDLKLLHNASSPARVSKPVRASTDLIQKIANLSNAEVANITSSSSRSTAQATRDMKMSKPTSRPSDHDNKGKMAAHQLKKDNPWSSYQGLVYTDDRGNSVGAFHLRKSNTLRSIVRVSPSLDESWVHELLKIEHKHIVRLWEVFQFDKDSFLVYEMMDMSLQALVACQLAFREPQVARVCAKILQAIRYLSDKHLFHNHINTSNILVSRNGEIKLSQIHICSRETEDSEFANSFDLWSLGQVMLEMMEPDSAILPTYKPGDTLKLTLSNDWSPQANDFLRNTSSVSVINLPSFITDLSKHVFLRKIDADDSALDVNVWLGHLTGMRIWSPIADD